MGRFQFAAKESKCRGLDALHPKRCAHRRAIHHHVTETIDVAHGHQSRDSFRQFLSREWRGRMLFCACARDRLDPGQARAQGGVGDCRLAFGEDIRGRFVLASRVDQADQHVAAVGAVVHLRQHRIHRFLRDAIQAKIGPRPKGKKSSRNAPVFDLRTELYRITGIDWAQVNGIDVLTAQTVIAEAGADLSAFPSEKQFTSWLGLCPTNEQSGGKILNRRTRKVVNRATVAFRNAALTLLRSQSYLGAQYRRLRTRLGAPKAITAMARKLACLFYRLIKHGQQYVDKGTEYYEARYREQQIRSLAKRAQKLGLQLVIPKTV
jgi:hypothetical protein